MTHILAPQVHIEQDRKTATITSVRAPFYRRVYSTLMSSLEKSGALRGEFSHPNWWGPGGEGGGGVVGDWMRSGRPICWNSRFTPQIHHFDGGLDMLHIVMPTELLKSAP